MVATVVITGAAGPLGQRVLALTAADPDIEAVIVIDPPGEPSGASTLTITHVALDLTDPDLKRVLEGATAIVHLGRSAPLDATDDAPDSLDGTGALGSDVVGMRALLDAAVDAAVRTIVVLSSAMVYGAWPNNPVPLTEDAPLRPDPELRFAIEKAEIERLAGEWREQRTSGSDADAGTGAGAGTDMSTGTTVAILRPTVAVGPESSAWLRRSPWSTAVVQIGDAEPPAQFVHLDDVASAVDLARRARLDGPFNVAADGWISAEQLRALAGPAPRVQLPNALAQKIASLRFRSGLTRTPPAVLPYTRYSWVVANDRLRAAGWEPRHTNEEAFVEADSGGPLASLNPKRRQLLAFGGVGVLVAGVVAGAVVLVRRRRR